ncbi:MAG TPA: aminomethyl-transferring glycine dehydrogenase [Planctomycetota bacterium]|nr:aminomethyl-transferring glycine dehydrogenase [Planctomycetota bacterium]
MTQTASHRTSENSATPVAPPLLASSDPFVERHVAPSPEEVKAMLATLGVASLDALIDETVPASIRMKRGLDLPAARTEHEALLDLQRLASSNRVWRSYLGMGYHDTLVPPVIQRNVLENPGWYTQYTPYQAEISQGRLEAMLNFQTMVCDLTGMQISNASLLDEGTAAAEAMHLCFAVATDAQAKTFFVSKDCHPQTIAVVRTRAHASGARVVVGDPTTYAFERPTAGALIPYPATDGTITDPRAFIERARANDCRVVVVSDPLALALLTPPGEMGADVVVGTTQRFGVPMGFGGPHAGFLATKDEHKRQMPGRLVGVSKDAEGRPAMRLALGTREQHIRRERATSNICTAQVLLAVMAGMYAVWHGPDGIRRIAQRVRDAAALFARGVRRLGLTTGDAPVFDTVRVDTGVDARKRILRAAAAQKMNLRTLGRDALAVSFDETTTAQDLTDLLAVFNGGEAPPFTVDDLAKEGGAPALPASLARKSPFLTHPVFHEHHAEHEMLRYLKRLEAKDLSLTTSMIPLGSCTMKLNASAEMLPLTWAGWGRMHPFAPAAQSKGYAELFAQLERWLAEITGFHAVSLQPNAGSQGEYAGLLVIRAYHESRKQGHRNVCLIPQSAHGTNPASAVMAGMKVVVVACDAQGNVDLADLKKKAEEHREDLSSLMITYPSTHGVFEASIREICEVVHGHGGQVYMDGANMNAQVGLCRPGDFGPDVCHLNLHKTFCIPHGGGGPGMGPIGVAEHLAPFLPGHPLARTGGAKAIGPIAAAPWGSASILTIPWVYLAMMGPDGLAHATKVAILNANYMAKRLESHYPVLYKGSHGRVAHEFILDLRPLKDATGIEAIDVAKRLMDYGFHAPTVSFPVAGTLMIEPTESESQGELDRLCDALIAIRGEIRDVAEGRVPKDDNPVRNAPHTASMVTASEWKHAYSRETAAFPAPWTRQHKFWPPVARIDDVYGDRNLMCLCPPPDAYA